MDGHICTRLINWRCLSKHVKHQLIVDLDERHFDSDLIIETAADFGEDFVQCARDESSVLVVASAAGHCEGLAGTSLTIAQDGAIEAVNYFVNSLLSAVFKDVLLGGVMEDFIEFKCPKLLGVIDYSL